VTLRKRPVVAAITVALVPERRKCLSEGNGRKTGPSKKRVPARRQGESLKAEQGGKKPSGRRRLPNGQQGLRDPRGPGPAFLAWRARHVHFEPAPADQAPGEGLDLPDGLHALDRHRLRDGRKEAPPQPGAFRCEANAEAVLGCDVPPSRTAKAWPEPGVGWSEPGVGWPGWAAGHKQDCGCPSSALERPRTIGRGPLTTPRPWPHRGQPACPVAGRPPQVRGLGCGRRWPQQPCGA
jgi:hypothetical protein